MLSHATGVCVPAAAGKLTTLQRQTLVTLRDGPCITDVVSGVIVIVAYRPKPGSEQKLLELVRSRVPLLRGEGLVTDREPVMMRARDGTIIEVSEWKSPDAIDLAHKNQRVWALWQKFFAICDCVPLSTLAEADEMFAGFEPVD